MSVLKIGLILAKLPLMATEDERATGTGILIIWAFVMVMFLWAVFSPETLDIFIVVSFVLVILFLIFTAVFL